MKKSANPIDQSFKDSFQGATEPVDAEALWPFVEQNLPEKDDRGLFLYLLLGIIFLLAALAGYVWLNESKAETAVAAEPLAFLPIQDPIIIEKVRGPLDKKKPDDFSQKGLSGALASGTDQQANPPKDFNDGTLTSSSFPIVKDNKKEAFTQVPQFRNDQLSALPPLSFPALGEKANRPQLMPGDPKWSRCSDKRSLDIGFLIEGYVFGGIPLLSNRLNKNQNIDYQEFLRSWNQSEAAVSTFAGGLLIGLESQWGGSISTGIEYQQIQNRFSQEQRILERVTIFDEMAYFFLDSNNNRVYVADSVTTTRTYTRKLQTAKTHTLVNLPVLLGYHKQKGRFRYGVIGGVIFHLRNEFKGKALDASGQIVDASTGSPFSIYRKDLNVSVVGGLDAGYMIQEGLELYVSPRFRFQGDSWLNADHPLISRIQLVGLQAGLRLHL